MLCCCSRQQNHHVLLYTCICLSRHPCMYVYTYMSPNIKTIKWWSEKNIDHIVKKQRSAGKNWKNSARHQQQPPPAGRCTSSNGKNGSGMAQRTWQRVQDIPSNQVPWSHCNADPLLHTSQSALLRLQRFFSYLHNELIFNFAVSFVLILKQ